MASDAYSANCSSILIDNASEKRERNCLCCMELSRELQKATMDILSYKEIIKVLQEELSKKESSEQKDYSGDLTKVQSVKEDWVHATNKNSRKLNEFNSNFIQIIPTTVNILELLTYLRS
jgi:hypothetical protein